MGKIYDDWGRLVEAVLRRDELREIAMCHSRESSISINNGSSRFSSSFTSHSPDHVSAYEALPNFSDVSSSEKPHLFIMKSEICCVVFDFSDPTKNLEEKETKRQTLLELVDYITSANVKFTEIGMQAAVKMVSVNIFRDFTPPQRKNEPIDSAWPIWQRKIYLKVDTDMEADEPVVLDPAWPHLQIVYDILLKLVVSPETVANVAKRHINCSLFEKLLNLFESKDPRERECLKIIIHRIYWRFVAQRHFIRTTINNIFYQFVFETGKHNGIGQLLEIVASLVNGFALPLKEEHKRFLIRTLIPLHKPKCLAMYHEQLMNCIKEFVKKDCKFADIVIWELINCWPLTNTAKEVLFLIELEEVLKLTQAPEFGRCMVPLFRQISCCSSSLHSQVAETALSFWNNKHITNLIKQNCNVILPIVFPALGRNIRHHWNQVVHDLTLNVRKIFYELDPSLFKACQIKFKEDELKENEIKKRRKETWERLEQLALESDGTNIVPKLQQKLESRHADLEFERKLEASLRFMIREEDFLIKPTGKKKVRDS